MEDVYEPLEEGLDTLVFKKRVVEFVVELCKNRPENVETYGLISEPIPEE